MVSVGAESDCGVNERTDTESVRSTGFCMDVDSDCNAAEVELASDGWVDVPSCCDVI